MGKYSELIALLEPLRTDSYGEWIFDNTHAGTNEDPKQMPFPRHTKVVHQLIEAIIKFTDDNPDFELKNYNQLLEDRGLEWKYNVLIEADVSNMDGQGEMAMFTGLLCGERFCEGTLLAALKKWNSHKVARAIERNR